MQRKIPPHQMRKPHRVDDRALRRIDPQPLSGLRPLITALQTKRRRREHMHPHGRMFHARPVRPASNRDVHSQRQLVAEIPAGQRRVQTDHPSRHPRAHRRQIRARADRRAGTTKHPTPHTDNLPPRTQPVELIARNASTFGLSYPKRPITEPLIQHTQRALNTHLLQTLHHKATGVLLLMHCSPPDALTAPLKLCSRSLVPWPAMGPGAGTDS